MKNIRAKKSLGQNFLKSKKVLEKIVAVSNLKKGDLVLEVGPGKGALTEKILSKDIRLIVIEKDYRLIPFLKEKFQEEIKNGRLKIFEGDALKINYKKLNLEDKNFKIIANLPYYITGKFLSSVLSNNIQPSSLVLMLQKAVVERIILPEKASKKEKDGFKENLLSLSIKLYGQPEFVMSVSAKNFSPSPKVDSAVLKVSNISKSFFKENKIKEEEFFDFLKKAFSGKRKKMIKNLVEKKFSKKDILEKILFDLKIDLNSRAEDISLEDFKRLFNKIE